MHRGLSTLVATAAVVIAAAGPAQAQEDGGDRGPFGLGLIVGSPTGLSLEYRLGESNAIHGALGVGGFDNRGSDGNVYIHVVWKFYLAELASTADFTLPIYVGVGPFISNLGNNTNAGARGPFGIAFAFNRVPIDIFAEIPLLLQVVDDVDLRVGVALGFHYFF